MSDTESIRVSRLNDENYLEWVVWMEAVLIKRGLWSVISHSIVWTEKSTAEEFAAEVETWRSKRTKSKMQEARAELILRVKDSQLSHMRDPDPLVIWQNLECVHRATGFATSLALRRKFLSAKKSSHQSMQAWIGHIQSLAFRLEETSESNTISDQDCILALTMGLPSSYDAVIINFDSTPPNQLTLNHVIARLLNEEQRQSKKRVKTSDDDTQSADEALAVSNFKSRPRLTPSTSSTSSANLSCYFCDGVGHIKRDCPERKKWQEIQNEGGSATAALDEEWSDDNSDVVI
jgi:hypothetical protein